MKLDKVVPFGRSLDEYRNMFALTDGDLDKDIIGVGDGPASFNAEMSALGRSVLSVDPLYVFGPDEIEKQFSRRCQSYHYHRICTVAITMLCEFCGGNTKAKSVKRQHWLNNKLYIVENVQAGVCIECGERYFHAGTLDALDEYLSKRHAIKERLDVEVVSFNQVVA